MTIDLDILPANEINAEVKRILVVVVGTFVFAFTINEHDCQSHIAQMGIDTKPEYWQKKKGHRKKRQKKKIKIKVNNRT